MAMPIDTVAVRAFVGVGSNLDDPPAQVRAAFTALDNLPQTRVVARSSLYRSAPLGPQDQPEFINAAVELETHLPPEPLLDALQAIETAQGRERTRHWGPRTLDIDLLLYGGQVISTPRLKVPHPGLPQRHFVLYPLTELAPDLEVPGMGKVSQLAAMVEAEGIERVDT